MILRGFVVLAKNLKGFDGYPLSNSSPTKFSLFYQNFTSIVFFSKIGQNFQKLSDSLFLAKKWLTQKIF